MRFKFLTIDIYVRKGTIAAVVSLFIVLITMVIKILISSNAADIVIENNGKIKAEMKVMAETEKPNPTPKIEDEIKVYVLGSVLKPGIVTLRKGQIIEDAITLAGGLTEEADFVSINRVFKLRENVMLFIKSKEELKKQEQAVVEKQWQAAGESGPGAVIVSDSGGSILNSGNDISTPKKININVATKNELDTLPGIGIETAQSIIEYRTANGPFGKDTDIMKIPGIKESKYSKIKDLIVAE